MNKIYDIDFSRLVQMLVPPVVRRLVTVSWLLALIRPVVTIYQGFIRYRKQKLYELTITPQVCYLERLLNDKYDFILRRIRIDDTLDKHPIYLFQEDELKPVFIYQQSENKPVYLFTDGEAGDLLDDFVIFVPSSIKFSDNEMLQLVKSYRLAAMKPKIQRV